MITASRTTGAPNEDFAVATESIAIVVDGAGVPVSGCIHSVPWFSQMLATHTLTALDGPEVSLKAALASGIRSVSALHQRTCDLTDGMTPCAAVGMVRFGEHTVDVLSLADVSVCIETTDGVDVICDQEIEALCGSETGALAGLTLGTGEHESALAALVDCQTEHRNRDGGWWVAASDPDAADHAVVRTYDREHVRRLVAMSDGATRPVDQMGIYDWTAYLDLLAKLGPAGLIDHVRSIEAADPVATTYPRTKCHDDASIAVWHGPVLRGD